MTAENIGVCFGPNLLKEKTPNQTVIIIIIIIIIYIFLLIPLLFIIFLK